MRKIIYTFIVLLLAFTLGLITVNQANADVTSISSATTTSNSGSSSYAGGSSSSAIAGDSNAVSGDSTSSAVSGDSNSAVNVGNVGSSSSAGDSNSNAVTGDSQVTIGDINSNNESVNLNAPIPGSVSFGPAINYFGQALPSEGFQPLQTVLMYAEWFSDGALEAILKKAEDAEAEMKLVDLTAKPAPGRDENGDTKWIRIVVHRAKYVSTDMAFLGYVTARSNDRRTTTVEVMAKAALAALKAGANVIHFTAEGACRDAFSTGWGIGFNSTQATIMNGTEGKQSNASSGGFGYSSAKAGMRDLPWLQGFALIDYTLTPPANKEMLR